MNTSARILGPCLRPMARMTASAMIPPAKKLMKIEKNPIRDAMKAAIVPPTTAMPRPRSTWVGLNDVSGS